MRVLLMVSSISMIVFTLICGFWIRSQPKVEKSSIDFHMWLALATVGIVLATLFYLGRK